MSTTDTATTPVTVTVTIDRLVTAYVAIGGLIADLPPGEWRTSLDLAYEHFAQVIGDAMYPEDNPDAVTPVADAPGGLG